MPERRKLELQLNIATEIELLYDEPVVGKSQYGDYYLYAVKSLDTEFAFFAPEEIHTELQNLRRGDKAIVTKSAEQRGNKLVTKYLIEHSTKSVSNNVNKDIMESDTDKTLTTDGLYEKMLISYKDAMRIQAEVGLVDISSVVRLAITLFIQRSR